MSRFWWKYTFWGSRSPKKWFKKEVWWLSVCINPPYMSHFGYDRDDFRHLSFFRKQHGCNWKWAQSDYSKVYFTWGRTLFFRFFAIKASFLHVARWFSVVKLVSGYLFPKNGHDLPTLRRLHFHRNVHYKSKISAHCEVIFAIVELKLALIKHFLKIST